jgi:hypothetical protein
MRAITHIDAGFRKEIANHQFNGNSSNFSFQNALTIYN